MAQLKWKTLTPILLVVLVGLGALVVILGRANTSSETTITVVSFGGAYQKAQSMAYMQPFQRTSGLGVLESDYDGDYGILKERATSPTGVWDVVSVESAPCTRGGLEGIFRELPDSVFSGVDLVPGSRRRYAAGHLVFSTILGYSTETFSNTEDAPKSWLDFWDVDRFPGKRGLRNNPRGTLEIALLSTGIRPAELYPLDVDRAFEALSQLRESCVFWDSGAQPVQLLANRSVSMTSVYNGRIWDAREKEQLPVNWTLNQGLMETEFWVVPKNSQHPEAAFDFIEFSLKADRQAEFANQIAYGPTNLAAIPLVKDDIKRVLPNTQEALPLQILVDAEWWAENEGAVAARWEAWKSGGR